MSSGKVRIYELSKELDLDNRDILAVCEQLKIPVKSHSSTISDAEAERIRTAAEKYSRSPSSTPSHSSSSMTDRPTPSAQNLVQKPKKQQILEVRKPAVRLVPPPEKPASNGAEAPDLGDSSPAPAPPRPTAPVTPRAAGAGAANPPVRPVRPGGTDRSLPERPVPTPERAAGERSIAPKRAPEPARSEELPARSIPAADAGSPADVAPSVAPSVEVPARAPLRSAPVRPQTNGDANRRVAAELAAPEGTASQDFATREPRSLTNRPLIKRPAARGEQDGQTAAPAPVVGRREGTEGIRRPERPNLDLQRPRPAQPGSPQAPSTLPRPVRNPGGSAPGSVATDPNDSVSLLNRPTPPRPPKQRSKAEEAEDEANEMAKLKAAGKTKRRPVYIVDEDEELLEDASGTASTAIEVSLSLARPAARPKQKTAQPRQVTAKVTPASGGRRHTARDRREQRRNQEQEQEKPTTLVLTGDLTVQELAQKLHIPETDIIKAMFLKGSMVNINQSLDIETASAVAKDLGFEVETQELAAPARKVTEMLDAKDLEYLIRRPPVVTIMGHVDHGKTTLLDSIRKTKVAQGEAGGITQHIGAYHVEVEHNGEPEQIVFLDTPGHEAFTAMRARGARVTDIAILVVAADDGVRPQTIEAISHARAAEVPIVVAINKIDKADAQPDRVKQELSEHGLVPEEWGGDTIMVPVSAIAGDNLDTLLEMLLLVSEVEDLQANPGREAKGTVIEAHLDKARGPVATLLVQNGTLHVGDILLAGPVFGKVRALVDDRGKRVDVATPSFAVEVLGLSDVPAAGDEFEVFTDERLARATAGNRADAQRTSRLQQSMFSRRVTLGTLSAQAQEGELKELNLILKADVQGSVEAILGALGQLPQNEVQVRVLLSAPGEISETDVDLAAASNAVIVGFNTTLAPGARQAADRLGVDVRDYNIIYKLLEDIQGAMEGLLDPETVEEALGQAEVRAVFPVGRGTVAGCYVKEGKLVRNSRMRVRRGGEVVFEGNLDSLKRMKEDTREVASGYECGVGSDNFQLWQEGDIIEGFRMVSKRRTLSAS
ncbi:translation initiation factor IF-2 [Leptolyngbya sp. FACHB-261]|uniref:translation initiation factor IF-2 n=1 Tax=Leptolyngbya sp. FACHB-261 TaxID=2692806 RepID=UPI0016885D08|nr:translation initiation factor IF-2 [Leptolyngbya sp. FACHB-261]MBD2100509.1 translation initiation factor IF-2 [Leptolyngbya sp. FACHB-261]